MKFEVARNAGHPGDSRAGFDLLFLDATTQAEMDALVNTAKRKFWQPWLIGTSENTGQPGGVMYKPSGANAPWQDHDAQH